MAKVGRVTLSTGVALLCSPCLAVGAPPKGAVKLDRSRLVQKSGFFCGNTRGNTWVPGRSISGGYFYSHQAERSNLQGQLKSASKRRKSKIRAQISALTNLITTRSGECSADPRSGTPTPGPRALQFNFSGAVGLALNQATGAAALYTGQSGSQSNLKKVDDSGRQSDAVTSGTATISRFLIAPNDKLYVLFNGKVNLSDTSKNDGKGCLLAEVAKSTGIPSCIEAEVSSIRWTYGIGLETNKPIQFDDQGSINYLAYGGAGLRLRRYANGSITDLINDNIDIRNFLVMGDGNVYLAGSTQNTGAAWFRRITPAGSLQTVASIQACNIGVTFLRVFPDGKIYTGIDDCNRSGIYRMSNGENQLESSAWWGYATGPYGSQSNPTPVDYTCPNDGTSPAQCGSYTNFLHRTPDGKIYAVAGSSGSLNKVLWRTYPSFMKPTIPLANISVFQGVLTNLVMAGTTSQGSNVLHLFNTSDNSSIELIGADNEIEIYRLNFAASTNRIMFDGLRFSDNKYVIGQYDLNTMTFSASQTGSTKLVDFQTF